MKVLFFVPVFFTSLIFLSAQELNLDAFKTDQKVIQNGLEYTHFIIDTNASNEPLSVHVLHVDLDEVKLELALAMDQIIGQETTSSMARRKGAIAAVNGGFSYSNNPRNIFHGDPKDVLIKDGEMISGHHTTRASFGWVNIDSTQIPLLAQFEWVGYLTNGKDTIHMDNINCKKDKNKSIIYSPSFNKTTLSTAGTKEIILNREEEKVIYNEKGANVIPKNGYIIGLADSITLNIDEWQEPQLMIYNQNHFRSSQKYEIKNSFFHTAGPILMLEGNPVDRKDIEQIPEAFVTTRHPRTGVGISKDRKTIWLLVVDGRQPKLSVGMSLPELTSFLQQLGAWEAYNLDGGGSTTMYLDGQVINSPSDGNERRRCDALLLFPKH